MTPVPPEIYREYQDVSRLLDPSGRDGVPWIRLSVQMVSHVSLTV